MVISESAKIELEKIKSITNKFIRIYIEGGGCSGFSYVFDEDNQQNDDTLVEDLIIIDSNSWPFLENSRVDFVNDLTGRYFKVEIPEAKSFCGCGTSFSI